ncbi:GNAT family N-acetyltransferase [Phytoactinopolyspora halophila]|uniref:GNAT family N-acetyltransferase n=1 Tax=Phytoactinopolyspora halophila TaxID=1981511 RepID=UPI000F4FFC7E|nr:GNAT family N-acetyltransferase [Phytoactinopolyspora halophila]
MQHATAGDLPAIRSILARAYTSDPLMRWIFPDDEHRLESTAAWLGVLAERYFATGSITTDGAPTPHAVAVWQLPGGSAPPDGSLPTAGGLLAALIGTERAGAVGNGLRAIQSVTPSHPFAYLQFLAVHPDWQRRGHGTALLRAGLDEARRRGLPVQLETTNPENVPFYRAHGFEVTSTLDLPPDGPTLWAMSHYPGDTTNQ